MIQGKYNYYVVWYSTTSIMRTTVSASITDTR